MLTRKSQISQRWLTAVLAALSLVIVAGGAAFAAEGRRSLADLKNQEDKIRRDLEKGMPNLRPFNGCLDAVANPWEQCVRPAFVAIPARQVTPERGEDFEGIQSYALRYEESGKIYYVSAGYVPQEKRNDRDIAFVFAQPDDAVQIDDIGIPGAYYKPLPDSGSIFKAFATGELIDVNRTGDGQTYEYYASLEIEFMCDGMRVGAGVDEKLPRDLGDRADAVARQRWQANMSEARDLARRAAQVFRDYEVCVPGTNAFASLTNPDGTPNANLQQGDTFAPLVQDMFDTFFRQGYAQERAAFGWANTTVEEGMGSYSFPSGTPGLE